MSAPPLKRGEENVSMQPNMGRVTQAETDAAPSAAHHPPTPRVGAMSPRHGPQGQTTGHYHPRRPLWLRALNVGGQVWQRLSLPQVRLDADQLLEAACQRTGLHDFGAIPLQEPLQLLLDSCEHEARLNVLGRLAVRQDVLQLLVNRLVLEEDWKRTPGIVEQDIV